MRVQLLMSAWMALFPTAPRLAAQSLPAISRVGVAASVRGPVELKSPDRGLVGHVLGSGNPVYQNDVITTGPEARLQILFLDETVFTVGPNTSLVLDKFVYDPAHEAGELTVRVLKGVFRFITGKISKRQPSNMKVKLPVGIIGIFGTMASGKVEPNGDSLVLLEGPGVQNNVRERVGEVEVESQGRSVRLLKPGYATTIANGAPPSPPFEAAPALLQELGALLVPPPAPAAAREEPAGSRAPAPATAQAGQDKAEASVMLEEKRSIAETKQEMDQISKDVSQDTSVVPDGTSTWDQVRGVQLGGTARFSGSGAFNCPGCGGGPSTWSYTVDVSFANKSLNINADVATVPFSNFLNNYSVSYADTSAYSGNAVVTSPATANLGDPGSCTYTFTFQNSEGAAAKQIVGTVTDSGGAYNGSSGGPVTSTR